MKAQFAVIVSENENRCKIS